MSTTTTLRNALILATTCALACGEPGVEPVEVHPATLDANEAYEALPLGDPTDFNNARRGLLASEPDRVIRDETGRTVWDFSAYAFLEKIGEDAPDSVNPSLWRQARLNQIHGLFEVVPGVYQVRGYDLSNLTVIEGKTGWIVVDPLTAKETAAAAWDLVQRTLGERPVSAVLFTHSHIDHFGGVEGVIGASEIASRGVRVVAPARFLDEATSENLLAGIVMRRRADLMYGRRLPVGPGGHVDSGLGPSPAFGSVSLVEPTDLVSETPTEMLIDGVRFVFQYTPESEAPAEFTFYLPDQKAFCSAEVATRTMHNLYTLRGAKVRDALRWSGYLDEALQLFGGEAEVVFASHHWPTWGNEEVRAYLARQRDTYKYIHDQTLRLASSGATSREIAERLELPESLRPSFSNRGYYGTVRHNAKAVYQWYFGWYDGNPANLDPLPPEKAGQRYVKAMGGAEAVMQQAQQAFDAGEHRWAATLLDHLVFADPSHDEAAELLARTYDELGYRAESGPWRDVYLSGALELREGRPTESTGLASARELLRRTPIARFFDAFATRLDGPAAEGVDLSVSFVFTDAGEAHRLWIENAVLHHRPLREGDESDVTVSLTRDLFLRLITGGAGLRDLLFSDELAVEGSRSQLLRFFGLLETPEDNFAIVRP